MTTISTNLQKSDTNNLANIINYIINQKLFGMNTSMPCIFDKYITNGSALYGSVTQLINNVDINNNPQESPLQFDVPIGYISGGNAGLITNYKKDDIVVVLYSQQSLSDLKIAWNKNNTVNSSLQPTNYGRFTLEDGIILCKIDKQPPSVFIKVTDEGGVEIVAPGLPVTVTSQSATINANEVNLGTGAANALILEGVELTANIGGVQSGSGVTNVPVTFTAGGSSKVKAAT